MPPRPSRGQNTERRKWSECVVFFDFDNTITRFDVIDDMLERFSINRDWVRLEHDWKSGRIGSKECLGGQLRGVRRTKNAMQRYLSTVPIDPYFRQLVTLLKEHNIQPTILSDNFSWFIKEILKHHGIQGVEVHGNEVRFSGNRLFPSFPYHTDDCPRCAHCKKQHLLNSRWKGKILVYVGDGLSDVCPAPQADVVFAKERLLDYCRNKKIPCVAFKNLRDVDHSLRRQFE